MPDTSRIILERFRAGYGKDIDLTLRPAYRDLLAKLGNPHKNLPPLFHVAGTNGKGSTCAFLRAMLEAAGHKVHVYTSPHLVSFHERIRIAGKLISEAELADILTDCERLAESRGVSYFEAATAAAFVAFARHPAGFTILETGLGGRLDATNVVDRPLATIITRLSYDHRDYLGDRIDQIAREKAGIMRPNIPCFTAPQPNGEAAQALRDAAQALGAPLSRGGIDWRVDLNADGFVFTDATRSYQLPPPALLGHHQYLNAGLAIAALAVLPKALPVEAIAQGLQNVEWLARLQRLTVGRLIETLPMAAEVWLDGGHNDSAGEVLAAQIDQWRAQDGRPLDIVIGMLTTKNPSDFLSPFLKNIARVRTVTIESEPLSFTAGDLAANLRSLGLEDVAAMGGVADALGDLSPNRTNSRILICGSLYLAGKVLALNGA